MKKIISTPQGWRFSPPSPYSFIHSGHFYSAPSSPLLLRGAPDYSTDTVSEFHAEAHRQLHGKGLAQGPYMAARAGVEPTTLRLRVIASTNAPPSPYGSATAVLPTIRVIIIPLKLVLILLKKVKTMVTMMTTMMAVVIMMMMMFVMV